MSHHHQITEAGRHRKMRMSHHHQLSLLLLFVVDECHTITRFLKQLLSNSSLAMSKIAYITQSFWIFQHAIVRTFPHIETNSTAS
jgi:hypothetical protein